MSIENIINEVTDWIKYDGIEGVAKGEKKGKECILVLSSRPEKELLHIIPKHYKGFDVVIQNVGIISSQ